MKPLFANKIVKINITIRSEFDIQENMFRTVLKKLYVDSYIPTYIWRLYINAHHSANMPLTMDQLQLECLLKSF